MFIAMIYVENPFYGLLSIFAESSFATYIEAKEDMQEYVNYLYEIEPNPFDYLIVVYQVVSKESVS